MRIVFFRRGKKRTGATIHIARAFRFLGHRVTMYQYNRWRDWLGGALADRLLCALTRARRPDFILVWQKDISHSLLARLGQRHNTGVIWTEARVETPDALYDRAKLSDLFLLSNTGRLESFRQLGVRRPVFWPQAADEWDHRPAANPPAEFGSDVAFIGKPGLPTRQALLRELDRHFQLRIWGPAWEPLAGQFKDIQFRDADSARFAAICSASKVMIGSDVTNTVRHYWTNRLWLTLACGGFLATNYVPGMEDLLQNHRHLVWYNSIDECVELVRHYLAHDEERRRVAEAGCKLVHEKHTYIQRVEELVKMIGELPAKSVS